MYGLMECPIMWGVSVKDRAMYGLMECPIMWESQYEGSRSVRGSVPLCGESVWGSARCMNSWSVPLCGESVWGSARCVGSWSVPLCGESVWGSWRRVGSWNVHYVGSQYEGSRCMGECPIMWGVSMRERAVYGLMECAIMWGASARERAVMRSWSAPLCRMSMSERAVYGLMECPIMWEVNARERVVYGLMQCPIIWGQPVWGSDRSMGSWSVPLSILFHKRAHATTGNTQKVNSHWKQTRYCCLVSKRPKGLCRKKISYTLALRFPAVRWAL